MSRSKKIRLGFVVVNTRTSEYLSDVFPRREEPRKISHDLNQRGVPAGVRTLETHVHEGWKKGDPLPSEDMSTLAAIKVAVASSREEQEKHRAVELAMGRIFRLGSRPSQPGDVEQYEEARAVIMSYAPDTLPDYRPNYARDRHKGASGD